ncbi:hypothetical protein [Oscillibacter sp.]|uniref:hypothetical protein n=1 Tax=Oscillibacter sp. TaxID=1945593 RepID=UPI001B454590|nr:hypothetical protein [Oscillibacter sp.]MBP3509451.1 hypothetical protein [Oscillibacter sp.]
MADGGRTLLYAACRELQMAGEALRRERRLFTPDEVTQYVSDGEARTAARTVLALSGVTLNEAMDEADGPDKSEETDIPDNDDTFREDGGRSDKQRNNVYPVYPEEADFGKATVPTMVPEIIPTAEQAIIPTAVLSTAPQIRRETVQMELDSEGEEFAELAVAREKRLETVQGTVQQMSEIRPENVQFPEDPPADGQVSREFFGNDKVNRSTPSVGADLDFEPLNLALSEKNGGFMLPLELSGETQNFSAEQSAVHEIKPEVREAVHENTSEIQTSAEMGLHEITSDFPETPHETTSEFGGKPLEALHETESEVRETVHEIKSDFAANGPQALHETKSDFQNTPHETKSEFDEDRREALHETTSELAEQVAQRLLEGLRRAAAVR